MEQGDKDNIDNIIGGTLEERIEIELMGTFEEDTKLIKDS